MRPDKGNQIADFAEMIHPDFEHAIFGVARQRRQRQRHAPVIVVGRGRDMGAAQRVQGMAQNFLGGGLAGAAGDGKDFGVAAGAGGAGQIFQPALGVGDGEQAARSTPSGARDTSAAPALAAKAARDKIMAVAIVALQRHEQIAFLQGAGVDRKPVHGKARAGLAQGGAFGFGGGPQRHAARPPMARAALTASSRSEKGMTLPPIYWPVSWPLPAITSTSP